VPPATSPAGLMAPLCGAAAPPRPSPFLWGFTPNPRPLRVRLVPLASHSNHRLNTWRAALVVALPPQHVRPSARTSVRLLPYRRIGQADFHRDAASMRQGDRVVGPRQRVRDDPALRRLRRRFVNATPMPRRPIAQGEVAERRACVVHVHPESFVSDGIVPPVAEAAPPVPPAPPVAGVAPPVPVFVAPPRSLSTTPPVPVADPPVPGRVPPLAGRPPLAVPPVPTEAPPALLPPDATLPPVALAPPTPMEAPPVPLPPDAALPPVVVEPPFDVPPVGAVPPDASPPVPALPPVPPVEMGSFGVNCQ
jgi:hypothetical protein